MTSAILNPSSAAPLPVRLTRAKFHTLYENGSLDFDRHYELIEGEIVMMPKLREPHAGVMMFWMFALANVFGQGFTRIRSGVVIDDESEPEPDLSVAAHHFEVYMASGETPPAADVRLLIEISVNTLANDLGVKAQIYARGGVPDYWVSDVLSRRLIVHRDPSPTGYASIATYSDADSIAPLAAPTSSFRVADYLP